MRAAILHEYGEPPRLGDFDEPAPGEGRIVVDVQAAGLNPVDLAMASGSFYAGSPPLPCVAGREGVGRAADGTLVYFDRAVEPYGSFAERAPVESSRAIELPVHLDPALATCFGIAGMAAWLALDWRAELRAGETVLVLGASGVVGQIAVQAARLMGAGRVVAAARSDDGLERARELGADAVVPIGRVDDLALAFRESCGDGPDVVVDPVWGEPAAAALDACRARPARPDRAVGRLAQLDRLGRRAREAALDPRSHDLPGARRGQARRVPADVRARRARRAARRDRAGAARGRGRCLAAAAERAAPQARDRPLTAARRRRARAPRRAAAVRRLSGAPPPAAPRTSARAARARARAADRPGRSRPPPSGPTRPSARRAGPPPAGPEPAV